MCLIDLSSEGVVGINDRGQFMTTRIPRRELLSVCPDAENWLARPLVENPGIRNIIERYFALSAETAGSLDAAGQQLTSRHMIDMVALLLRTSRDETQRATLTGYSAARLQLIQDQVVRTLDDASLTIDSVAKHAGLTTKQVQRLFERAGTTFTEFVLEQRLLRARRLLSSPTNRRSKIGTIAYAVGFGDLSYFHRVFRRRFGVTPCEWRDAQPSYS